MRKLVVVALAVAMLAAVSACTNSDSGSDASPSSSDEGSDVTTAAPLPASETAGLVPTAYWNKQQADYLKFATSEPLSPGSPLSLLAHGTTEDGAAELDKATVADFEPIFTKLEHFEDTGDFDINNLLQLYLRNGSDLDPALAKEIKSHILSFKYWWTEPTPKGVIDSQYYWTENHQIIYLANEYVAGQTFADTTFTNDGKTGAQHQRHAEERLKLWFDWRSRFGFSEWLSNVYWSEDFKGLLLLAEFAEDPALARRASMALDLMFVELAAHIEKGTFGSTHGRSYQKDKLNGRDEDTFSTAKLAFDQTPIPYSDADNATLLAVADRYRPPEVARRIAASDTTAVFKLRAGLPLDPNAPVDASAKAPYGLSYTGEKGLMTWWGMGGQFPWQIAPLSVDTVKKYDLFKTTNFKQASSLEPIVADADDDALRNLAHSLAVQVNPGLLSQVNTYTWRSPGVMLSTAQDWRPGQRGEQDHIWQATLDPDALVFTQHPRDGVPSADDPNADEGYWTGDGAMPRSAQYENVNISIYAPQYSAGKGVGSGAYAFSYEPYTHAFFPTENFDEVVERDGWVIGRKGDGYVALWSHRPTTWKQYTSDEFTRGLKERFDLIADGGPDNVWITEVGNASDHPGAADPFAAFVDGVTASKPVVQAGATPDAGATVTYDSPSQGPITFGWTPHEKVALPPLTVMGKTIDLHPEVARWDSPYATSAWDSGKYHASLDGATMDLDFTKDTRRSSR